MINIFETITSCRICESENIKDVLDLGNQPAANSLYRPDESPPPSVPLRLIYCEECSTVQLGETIEPEYLFGEYLWVTGTSNTANLYSHIFAENALKRSTNQRPYVVEIASNDGTFLKRFIENDCKVLGIDPAKNIAKLASDNEIPTLPEFFTVDLAKKLVEENGKSDIVFARNVLPHVKNIHSVVGGIRTLLNDRGVGIVEFHDAGLILEELHYDSIYHEHLFYFSLKTINQVLEKYDLHVFDIMKTPISGGSWAIYFSKDIKEKTLNVLMAEEHECQTGINTYDCWVEFASRVKSHSKHLKKMIANSNNKIPAYGASARSSTLLNFCEINSNHVSVIIDKNPFKQGLMTPGSDIPIVSFEKGLQQIENSETILLLAWNFKDEIIGDL